MYERQQFQEAETYLQKALDSLYANATLYNNHPSVALGLSHVGCVFLKQKKYAEAEVIQKQALIAKMREPANHNECEELDISRVRRYQHFSGSSSEGIFKCV